MSFPVDTRVPRPYLPFREGIYEVELIQLFTYMFGWIHLFILLLNTHFETCFRPIICSRHILGDKCPLVSVPPSCVQSRREQDARTDRSVWTDRSRRFHACVQDPENSAQFGSESAPRSESKIPFSPFLTSKLWTLSVQRFTCFQLDFCGAVIVRLLRQTRNFRYRML